MATPRASLKEVFGHLEAVIVRSSIGADNLNYALHGLSIEEGMVIRDALLPLLDAEPERPQPYTCELCKQQQDGTGAGAVICDPCWASRLLPLSSLSERSEMIAEKVREMDEAAHHARSWTQPGSCGIGTDMPCRHANCIVRAGDNTAYWTQLAARCAITLESLLDAEPEQGWQDLEQALKKLDPLLCEVRSKGAGRPCEVHDEPTPSCYFCLWEAMDAVDAALCKAKSTRVENARAQRKAWEAGFRLAVRYGDNWTHFDGEQKERHWQAYLSKLAPPRPSSPAAEEK